jgi:glycosyltransferase involved in cell wall biosynthesis
MAESLRLLILAPSWVMTPPVGHGPGQQHAADLAHALQRKGHSVTLFATGDSRPSCPLAWHFPNTDAPKGPQREREHVAAALRYAESEGFDLIHSNETNVGLLRIGACRVPSLIRMNWAGTPELAARFRSLPSAHRARTAVCAVSHALARSVDYLRPIAVVHNGIDVADYPADGTHGGPLLFLGRIFAEKGVDTAIDIAQLTGRELVLAGPVTDRRYFAEQIRPRLAGKGVEYVGPVDAVQKRALYSSASALLMPYRAPEPFGYALIEAMACGTPCIAFDNGSPAEVIEHGRTGFVVRSVAAATRAVQELDTIRSADCRQHVASHFSIEAMTAAYLRVYQAILPTRQLG